MPWDIKKTAPKEEPEDGWVVNIGDVVVVQKEFSKIKKTSWGTNGVILKGKTAQVVKIRSNKILLNFAEKVHSRLIGWNETEHKYGHSVWFDRCNSTPERMFVAFKEYCFNLAKE